MNHNFSSVDRLLCMITGPENVKYIVADKFNAPAILLNRNYDNM